MSHFLLLLLHRSPQDLLVGGNDESKVKISQIKQRVPLPNRWAKRPKHFPFRIVFIFINKSTMACPSCRKKLFSGDFIRKNCELYVNLTILGGFFAITRLRIIAATFRNVEKTRLNELYINVDKIFLLKWIFRKLYLKNWKKC